MIGIARSASSSAAVPIISEWIQVAGLLVDPVSISFEVVDLSDDSKEMDPVSVVGPTDADRVSLGNYAATWTVGSTEPLGKHEVRWSAQLIEGGPTVSWSRQFDVLPVGAPAVTSGYALLSEMRGEGMAAAKYSDARLTREIRYATDYIDKVTRRWFEPRWVSTPTDGSGKQALLLQQPIIGVDQVSVANQTAPVDESTFKVYNRHLAGMTQPDDRTSPKIEYFVSILGLDGALLPMAYPPPAYYFTPRIWPAGAQNVVVNGVFGYTDPDGSPSGETPDLIRRVCRMLVVRGALPLADRRRLDALNGHRLISERTREQSYTLAAPRLGTGAFTGDIEIDSILEMFLAPPQMGTV